MSFLLENGVSDVTNDFPFVMKRILFNKLHIVTRKGLQMYLNQMNACNLICYTLLRT